MVLTVSACGNGIAGLFGSENEASDFAGEHVVTSKMTFYGYDDNESGSGTLGSASIAYPSVHKSATEDLGTYDHPSTMAADRRVAAPGTLVYFPRIRKYYVMEDLCGACTTDASQGRVRVDLFIGGNKALQGSALRNCENSLTKSGYQDVAIFNPGPDYPVASTPLFTNGVCNTTTY